MRLFAVWLCSLLLWCATAQAQVRNYDAIIAAGELKVAVYKDFAPYSFEDHGKPRGVDVELAQALATALGVRLQLIWAPAGEKLDDDLRGAEIQGRPRTSSGPARLSDPARSGDLRIVTCDRRDQGSSLRPVFGSSKTGEPDRDRRTAWAQSHGTPKTRSATGYSRPPLQVRLRRR